HFHILLFGKILNDFIKKYRCIKTAQKIQKLFSCIWGRRPAYLNLSFLHSKKVVIITFITLVFGTNVLADYTINAGSTTDPATTPSLLNATGTISIYGTMAINSNVTFTSTTPLTILVYGTTGTIQWNNNCILAFPAGTTITYINTPT